MFAASSRLLASLTGLWLLSGCFSQPATALAPAEAGAGPVVKFDVFKKPFPDIPLPNDFATRGDLTSPTGRRLNASILAGPTRWEQATRAELDKLSGWGTLAPITVSFSEPLDLEVIFKRHHKDLLNFNDDAVLVVDVTKGSPEFCKAVPLDLGQGNYPETLQNIDVYPSDPRHGLSQHHYEEFEEDLNGNGVLDPGEDTDMDGVLDHPNTRDGGVGGQLLDFYERETNTLVMKPLVPMREATTYAVVLTKRLTSPAGNPVRSPFDGINHTAQTHDLGELSGCLTQYGLALSDVGFTWSFTTQNISADYVQVRDGLYGLGSLKQVGTDFPGAISKLRDLKKRTAADPNPKIVPGDLARTAMTNLMKLTGTTGATLQMFDDQMKFVDFMVMGEVQSPQFFPRTDAAGNTLPYYQQVWNLSAPPRAEAVPFWLFVPRNRTGPAPVAIFIHGHGGSKFDGLAVAGLFARYGIATLTIDAPSHGIGLDATTRELVRSLLSGYGLDGLADGLLTGRAIDVDGDGILDPGADYWTSYVFHTRDMVRQTMVDVMQVVRMLRSFDGKHQWDLDVNHDGVNELAGDFDADGKVDVGGLANLYVVGGSLGGITTGVASGVEPAFTSAIAIVPGGMLSEVGGRSSLGGVRNAMVLRMLGPLFYAKDGVLTMSVPEAEGNEAQLPLHALPPVHPKDTVVLVNHTTGEHRCGAVQADSSFRVSVPSDTGDSLEFRVYAGPLGPEPESGCALPDGLTPTASLTSFDRDVVYAGKTFTSGSPMVAVTDGFGLRRGTPSLRRMFGLSQIAMESGDPMNWAPYWEEHRQLTYGTGETVHTRVLMLPSVGDTGVPVATGIALARAAGFITYDAVDPRYGKSQNDELIDTWAVEGLSRTARYTDSHGNPVMLDLENFPSITGSDDGFDVPRLTPPLRLPKQREDGSTTGVLFVLLTPQGKHGFASPDPTEKFDTGSLLFNMMGHYLQTNSTAYSLEPCELNFTCSWTAPLP
jgi:hypothetical protein